MFTSQLLSRVFPCGGKRKRKHSNNSDRRHRFGTSLFHHFRKTASINDSSAVKNVATTKNYDDDNDNDNNNRSNTNNSNSKCSCCYQLILLLTLPLGLQQVTRMQIVIYI